MTAVIADVHLANHRLLGGESRAGLNTRAREICAVLARVAELVAGDDLVIAGDLFDTARPSPQLIAAALDALAGARVRALVGNHDQVSDAPGDHALGPLRHAGWAVVDSPTSAGHVCLPYSRDHRVSTLDRLEALLAHRCHSEDALVVLHAGIDDGETTPPWLRGAPGSVPLDPLVELASRYGVRAVVAGDWHQQKRWERRGVQVAQVGALAPTGWDNPGLDGYGGLVTWDGTTLATHQIPGPRFLATRSVRDLADQLDRAHHEHTIRAQVTAPLDRLQQTSAELEALAASRPALTGWRVVPDGAKLASETMEAVQRTHLADDRLAAWLDSYPLPDGVSRPRVAGLVAGALSRGEGS